MRNNSIQRRLLIALVMLVCASACSTYKPVPLGTIPAPLTPVPQEVQVTKAAVAQMNQENGYRVIESGPAAQRVQRIFARLTNSVNAPAGQWPIYLVDAGDEVNASAVNRNTVIVYSKLVERVKSDDELATVLAHELGHILGQHKADEGAEAKSTAIRVGGFLLGTVAAVASAYGGAGSGLADLAGDTAQAAVHTIGEGALLRSYDRAQEYEADQIGLMVMAKAGYNPESAVIFWERAEEVFNYSGGLAFLSTHPSTSARAEALRAALPIAMEYYNSSPAGKQTKVAANKVVGAVR